MIRIAKSRAPAILRTGRGPTLTAQLKAAYLADKADYDSGRKTSKIAKTVYGAKSVKKQLNRDQFDKCAFCESRYGHVSYGDVEHLRPKAGYTIEADEPLQRPGYYWLAYEWTNLFASCQLCNQRFKKNRFPLADESKRAKSHDDDISEEQPLLLDPAADDPSDHIEFAAEVARPRNGSRRGAATIEIVGLNRSELIEMRPDSEYSAMARHRIENAARA